LTPEKKSPSSFWVLAGAAACVVVSILAFSMLRTTSETDATGSEILDNHLRALEPSHLVDVPSSDQHTVKPWFQGKTSFSPPVPDLTANDFILIGGRLEVIHQQPTAAIVYKRRQHVMSSAFTFLLPAARMRNPDSATWAAIICFIGCKAA
jgi:anti-sigma factor RsiW